MPYSPHSICCLDIYTPASPALAYDNESTVVVFVFGGAWGSGDKSLYPLLAHTLSSTGFSVVVPNYTLFPKVLTELCLPICEQ